MLWAKELVEAGLAGLNEKEATRGTLCKDFFQCILSPNVKDTEVVSKFKSTLNLHVCIQCQRHQRYIFTKYCIFNLAG